MPWQSKDAHRHTHRAKSAKRRRQWREVANSVLRRTGDEGRAVRAANSVVKRQTSRKKHHRAHHRRHRRTASRA